MTLHVGLVGLGDAGRQHARVLAQLDREGACQWTAICARDPERIQAFREAHEVPVHARSYVGNYVGIEKLLDAGVCDALILATPDGVHAEQIGRCARRGVHALVEKPVATSREAARAALKLARSCNTVVRVGYHLRHHAGHQLVHARHAKLIGPLRRVDIQWSWPDPATAGWRARGEGRFWSLAALGTHCIDLARWFVGAEPRRLAHLLDPPMAIDEAAELSLAFPGEVVAHIGVSIRSRTRSRLLLVGERGEIECLGTLGARGAGEIAHREAGPDGLGEPQPLEFEVRNPYAAQLRAFIAAIHEAGPLDVEQALGNLAVLETIASGAAPIR